MSEDMLIRHCAPTLAGLKNGSLFSCPCSSRKELLEELGRLNRLLVPKGLRALPMRIRQDRALIYLFRPAGLTDDLTHTQARRLLEQAGYTELNGQRCVNQLIRRLNSCPDFPHEIGLFLSYPPEDVEGFIENRGSGCKCVGCWKVYGDEQAARRRFACYKQCTDSYCLRRAQGATVEHLAVAV